MNKKLKIYSSLGILLCLLLPLNCGKIQERGEISSGKTTVFITDAPFPFSNVAFVKIQVAQIEVKSSKSSRQLLTGPQDLDLLNLRNGITQNLSEANLPVGIYSEMIITINKGRIKLTDGREFSFTLPEHKRIVSSKISPAILVTQGNITQMLIDFDISKSFDLLSNPDGSILGFRFHPVFRVANLTLTSSVQGVILNNNETPFNTNDDIPLSGAMIKLSKEGITIASTVTNIDGSFLILGIEPAVYQMNVFATGFDPLTVYQISPTLNSPALLTRSLNFSYVHYIEPIQVQILNTQVSKEESLIGKIVSYNGDISIETTNQVSARIEEVDGDLLIFASSPKNTSALIILSDSSGETFTQEILVTNP